MPKETTPSPFSVGGIVAQKYRLIKQLGEGAMGVVWLAVNEVTSGEVALKLIVRPEPDLRHRLLREARACCAVRHRNIIQIHDVGTTAGGDPFLVMELLSGETLAEMLERKRRLHQEEAAAIARDIAHGLAAAHEKDIVHRDLKPANIFLHREPGSDGYLVKVLDFGVSKNLMASDGVRTVAGIPVGSPMYMSPEQASADPTTDGRSDIWSLGVVLFEMLTGQQPFTGDSMEVLKKVLMAEIPVVSRRIRKVDPTLEHIVTSCMQRRRELRPWPASELARQLDPFAGPAGRALTPVRPSAVIRPPSATADDALDDAATRPLDLGVPPGAAPTRPGAVTEGGTVPILSSAATLGPRGGGDLETTALLTGRPSSSLPAWLEPTQPTPTRTAEGAHEASPARARPERGAGLDPFGAPASREAPQRTSRKGAVGLAMLLTSIVPLAVLAFFVIGSLAGTENAPPPVDLPDTPASAAVREGGVDREATQTHPGPTDPGATSTPPPEPEPKAEPEPRPEPEPKPRPRPPASGSLAAKPSASVRAPAVGTTPRKPKDLAPRPPCDCGSKFRKPPCCKQ